MAEKAWRFLERLVAEFERVLGPQGAVIKSPDHLIDHDTGQVREVDASIRYPVGSVPILVTVECRDRQRDEDSTWIEQLAKKKEALRAHATIAVSSSGFGTPARDKAEKAGIELRQVSEIEEINVEQWFRALFVTVRYLTYRLVSIGIIWPNNQFPPGMLKEMELNLKDAWSSPVFREGPEPRDVSAADLLEGNWEVFQDAIGPVGSTQPKSIYCSPQGTTELFWIHRGKKYPVSEVELNVEIGHLRETIRFEQVRQYADKDRILAYAGHGKMTAGLDDPVDLIVLKRLGSEGITLTIKQPDPWWKRKPKKRRKAK